MVARKTPRKSTVEDALVKGGERAALVAIAHDVARQVDNAPGEDFRLSLMRVLLSVLRDIERYDQRHVEPTPEPDEATPLDLLMGGRSRAA